MQIMRDMLASRGYETIFFQSWEYGNEEKPWIPFMIKIVDALFEHRVDKKKLIRAIFLFSTDVVLQNYSRGAVSTGVILNLIVRSRINSLFKNWLDKGTEKVIERVNKIETFKGAIEKRAEESLKGKIIIFIDDLDRIPEDKIVDFLDSLKIFLDIRGCIFVLGCDYNILQNALTKKHEEKLYKDYFDKIVQVEFYIPKISEQAIRNYLHFLTGWNDDEIETHLVTHSIGGNPRKIKRVVNATMLIKSVFEQRLATLLQAFEKQTVRIERGRKGKEEEPEEPRALEREISTIFTPADVFDLLFDKTVLFKLVCMREQWFTYYETILIDKEKQKDLFSTTNEQGDKSNENLAAIFMKEDAPKFQGLEDMKTYLTLLEISSPEAGILMEYPEPETLPINHFNRYMMFERINKGQVDETIIAEKINHMDWESSLGTYTFFIHVIRALGYDHLLRDLFERNQKQIAERIEAGENPWSIGWLLYGVREIDEETAERLEKETVV
jgi:Predicted P-loop ATPase